MKIKLFVLFVILSIFLTLNAIVVEYNQLPKDIQASVIPDVEGNVFITEDFAIQHQLEYLTRELPAVHEGFPVSYPSPSNCYKGAIYCNMDDDEEMEIIYGVGKKVVALNLDGTAVPGWPVSNTYYIWSSPACGDIDGDGVNEIVATSRNNTTGNEGQLYAYELDGTAVAGFPITMAGGGTMNACLSDIDNDNDLEIFVNVRNNPEGWVYAFQGDGTVIEGWPAALDYVPGASISVADLDNDGTKEVIALSYNKLFVFDASGNTIPGFPFTETGITISYSQPTIYDMDGDGDKEIIYGACSNNGGKVYALHHDGTSVTGWPNDTQSWIFGTVALGDIDADGNLDVVVGDQVSSSEASNYIYAWDLAGNNLTGFPAGPTFAIYAQVAIADIDGDDNVEIMIDDNRYGVGYECYNNDGTHCAEWPLACGTAWSSLTMMITPVIGDFDNDGYLNIAGAATDIMAWVVEAYVWETNTTWNPDLAYSIIDGFNIQHDGLYPAETPNIHEPPQNVNAYLYGFNDVELNWQAPANAMPELYNIYVNDVLEIQLGFDVFTYTISGLDEGSYTCSISALYFDGIESEIIDANPFEIEFPYVENLTYEVLPTPQVNLSWDFTGYTNQRNFTWFNVYRDNLEISQVVNPHFTDLDVNLETSYQYYVVACFTGNHLSAPSNSVEVFVTGSDDGLVPQYDTILTGNYPNPFNPETKLMFSLTKSGNVKFNIYNIRGALVEILDIGCLQSGQHTFSWDASRFASGTYLIELEVNGLSYNKCKSILIK